MRTFLLALACVVLVSLTVSAQAPAWQDPLVERLVGKWVLTGKIEGKDTTHDVDAQWVVGHQYVRIHEISREKDAKGAPAYEAIVFIGWDPKAAEYDCLWLDSTGGTGLAPAVVGHAKGEGDRIPFLFKTSATSGFRNTFVYDRRADTWQWIMDGDENGKLQPFARLTLTRQKK